MSWTLALSGTLQLATAASFLVVGREYLRRPASGEGRLAILAAAVWWWSLAAYLLIQGGLTVHASVADASLAAFLVARVLTIPLLCLSVWGLTYHLVYLFTGKRWTAKLLALLYVGVAVLFYVAGFSPVPRSVTETPWLVELEGTGKGRLFVLVYALVGAPPIAASFAYLFLGFRLPDPLQRYRAILVAGSILAYIGSGLVARLASGDALKLVTLTVFGLGAGLAAIAAYRPPAIVRRWLAADRAPG